LIRSIFAELAFKWTWSTFFLKINIVVSYITNTIVVKAFYSILCWKITSCTTELTWPTASFTCIMTWLTFISIYINIKTVIQTWTFTYIYSKDYLIIKQRSVYTWRTRIYSLIYTSFASFCTRKALRACPIIKITLITLALTFWTWIKREASIVARILITISTLSF